MSFECRSKPSRFHLLLFIQYTWIHSWLQNSLCLESRICFGRIFLVLAVKQQCWSVPGCPADAATHVFWIMRLTTVNCFRSRLHRSSWSSRRQTRATASRMSSSSFKHNTTGTHTNIQHLKAIVHLKMTVCHHLFTLIVPNVMFFLWQCYFSNILLRYLSIILN